MSEGEENANEHLSDTGEVVGDEVILHFIPIVHDHSEEKKKKLDDSIGRALRNDPELIKIDLCGHDIGDTEASKLAASLLCNTFVEVLSLRCNDISDEGVLSLASLLRVNNKLRVLDLYKNNIGPKGAGYLASVLIENASLDTIDLSCNVISNDGAASLATMLLENASLRSLLIGRNKIDDEGVSSLSSMLQKNKSLVQLHLGLVELDLSDNFGDDNAISNDGATLLASAMEVNKTLTHLTLSTATFHREYFRRKIRYYLARNRTIIRINNGRDRLREQYNMLSEEGLADAINALNEDESFSGIAYSVLFSALQEIPEVMDYSFFSRAE